ncbi:hypothetical protein TOPH_07477 [Tolypocladium ophioglossoides CBS 100239]|uniref:F-box domain-containing protein n=1 Tax=Tolypocladium ophioglossoides (strain CBS 100239) TaxID=1163406 RepID=A0A0L0N1E6_TOLOC|nr:hypothetical protein TOPH_07477 [Tolypocladium ophioglossoides CBS 100239]
MNSSQTSQVNQLLDSLWGLRRSWFGSTQASSSAAAAPSPSTTPDAEAGSRILQLPADVLLLICDELETPEALSLSLACKSTYALCFALCHKKMTVDDRRKFLLLLEKDPGMGRGVFYCHTCNYLHPFQPYWGPHSEPEASSEPSLHHCGNRDRFAPIGNRFDLSYTHARLAMNDHFYGPGRGIPLENLCIEHTEHRDWTSVLCSTDAKIKNDELYLLRTYTFTIPNDSIAEFRKCTGARDFRLCEHTSFFSNTSVYRQYVPELQRRPASGGEGFATCKDSPGSCGLCLMDYDITIAPAQDNPAWDVTIKAHHQLGACRTPDDWKWARFTEACRAHLFFPNRPNRRGSTHNAGVVKQRWSETATKQPDAKKVSGQKSFPIPFPTWLWRDTKPLSVGSN